MSISKYFSLKSLGVLMFGITSASLVSTISLYQAGLKSIGDVYLIGILCAMQYCLLVVQVNTDKSEM